LSFSAEGSGHSHQPVERAYAQYSTSSQLAETANDGYRLFALFQVKERPERFRVSVVDERNELVQFQLAKLHVVFRNTVVRIAE
jgi:hypothetical protein